MKIEIEVADENAELIKRFASKLSHVIYEDPLTVESLVALFLEDIALVVRRPGCWEAVNAQEMLTSHGYYLEEGDI